MIAELDVVHTFITSSGARETKETRGADRERDGMRDQGGSERKREKEEREERKLRGGEMIS